MNVKPLVDKVKPKQRHTLKLVAIVQPDAIYLSSKADLTSPTVIMVEQQNWQAALAQALEQQSYKGYELSVVLCDQHYQSYQIDKPNMPRSEWPIALPFLIKDLINEPVENVVADAIPLPTNQKIHVYVISRLIATELAELAQRCGLTLSSIMPDTEVWGRSAQELQDFMLLQRSRTGHLKINAFVDSSVCFQRTVRSVPVGLMAATNSELELDSLALELQRSIDYLSSKLPNNPVHQLRLCCDNEQHEQLAKALNDRLNVNVDVLHETVSLANYASTFLSGEVLLETVFQSDFSAAINLYPTHLRPQKNYATLSNMLLAWGALAVVVAGAYGYGWVRLHQQQQELAKIQQHGETLRIEQQQISTELAARQPSSDKLAAIARLKQTVQAKQASLEAIGQFDTSVDNGYFGVVTSLAKLGRNDISLQHIHIDQHDLNMSGLAREASVVPNWISQFKSEMALVGRTFERIKLGRNDDDIVTFELHTRVKEKQ